MTLQEAIDQVTGLAPKAAGQLIKHTDWNDLVEAVVTIGGELSDSQERIGKLESTAVELRQDLNGAIDRIDTVEGEVDQVRQQIAPLLNQYLVTTRCDRTNYAMGEVCVITATVTTLTGEPVTDRPWIDFVASWGRLRRVGGFTSRAGVGDNSLSVQVNQQGIARVQLRADHTEGFTETEEQEIESSLNTRVEETGFSIAQTLLQANSPTEFTAKHAFTALSLEYERNDTSSMRNYVDTYFVRKPKFEYNPHPLLPNPLGSWRDYRSTVMAMAKPDGDPTTADYSRGSSSIQITFRDWIGFWINDFVLDISPSILEFVPKIEPIFATPLFEATEIFEGFVAENIANKGIVGRMKTYDVMKGAIDRIQVQTPDSQILKKQATRAVAMQGANDVSQMVYSVKSEAATAIPMASAILGVQQQAAKIGSNVDSLSQRVTESEGVNQSLSVLEGRMQAAESVGSNIDQRLNLINDSVKSISVFDETSIESNVNQITANIQLIRSQLGGR